MATRAQSLMERVAGAAPPAAPGPPAHPLARAAAAVALKLEALAWVAAAALAAFFGTGEADLFTTIAHDPRIKRDWLAAAAGLAAANAALFAYAALWLGWVRRVPSPETRHVWLVPAATAAALGGGGCAAVGIWPAFGFFTPLLLPLLAVGAIMSLHFVPAIGPLRVPAPARPKQA